MDDREKSELYERDELDKIWDDDEEYNGPPSLILFWAILGGFAAWIFIAVFIITKWI